VARPAEGIAPTVAIALVAALAIALVREPLSAVHRRVKETSDVYTLPPPEKLVRISLGYRSALADLLWAHVLVSQGLHTEEQRRYDNVTRLLDAINALEPTYRDPYLFAEALITFQVKETPREEVLLARAIMERGVENRPLDAEIWLRLGAFVAFVAPGSYLSDPAEQEQWRRDGAMMLERAAELAGDSSYIAWQAMGGAKFMSRSGQIRFLEHMIELTDDEELKSRAQAKLDHLLAEERQLEHEWEEKQRAERFRRLDEGIPVVRHGDLPHVSRRQYMVIGPPRDPFFCAGSAHAREPACAPSWRDWEELSEDARVLGSPRHDGGLPREADLWSTSRSAPHTPGP
jgi:hypothetical protein